MPGSEKFDCFFSDYQIYTLSEQNYITPSFHILLNKNIIKIDNFKYLFKNLL